MKQYLGWIAAIAIAAAVSAGCSSGHTARVNIDAGDSTTTALAPPATVDTSGPTWTKVTDTEAGFTINVPPGWSATTESLTQLTDPVERFTAATFPLTRWDGNPDQLPRCDVVLPAAVSNAGRADAFATIQERVAATGGGEATGTSIAPDFVLGQGSFANVPTHADLTCATSDPAAGFDTRWIRFEANGRSFYLAVVIGPDVSPEHRAGLWAMLDSFRPA